MFEKLIKKYYSTGGDIAGIASSAVGAGVNAITQSSMNLKTRQFADMMEQRTRQEALSDRDFNNAYNSPTQQMARLKAAGLNPNLIYGAAAAGGNSQPVRSSSVQSWNPTPPQWGNVATGVMQGVGNALNIRTQQAQLDNIQAQNALINAQTNNTVQQTQESAARTPGYGITQSSQQFDLDLKQKLQPITEALAMTSADQAKASLDKTLADTQFTLDKNQREELQNAQSLKQGILNMLNTAANTSHTNVDTDRIKQATENLRADRTIDQFEIDLNKKGLTKSDPEWQRVAAKVIDGLGFSDILKPATDTPMPNEHGVIKTDSINKWLKSRPSWDH